ncbi:DNA repair protein RecO [Shouchella sp. 1P09AA]|uniref:DNA repair protein RecO n=1 Tax=unclassified Shouchella TaxID=2893065 RepID=UPI0039A1A017
MLIKEEGIILKTIDYGESNKIATVLTKDHGKITLMAKGAKKPNSRYAAVMQPFVHGSFVYFKGNGLPTISQGEIIKSFKHVHFDLFKAAYAAYITELMDKLTEERKPYLFLFDWLYLSIEQIDKGQDPEIIARIIDLKMLSIAGAKPNIDGCASCRSVERDPVVFSLTFAGFLCRVCAPRDERAFPLTLSMVKLIRTLYYVDLNKVGAISIKRETKARLAQIISSYYQEYVGVTLKSQRFIDQLKKVDPDHFKVDGTKE